MVIINNHGERVKVDSTEGFIIGNGENSFSLAALSLFEEDGIVEINRYSTREEAENEVREINNAISNSVLGYFVKTEGVVLK